jgi:2-methylcitrate dehydratase PrpD
MMAQGASATREMASMDAITAFAAHVAERTFGDLPSAAVAAAKTFLLDTLGVGLIGSSGPKAQELVRIQPLWGKGGDARVWSTGERLPAPAAAFCNAYQVHNTEFDPIHEAAVAHVMTVVVPVALAGAERMAKVEGSPVDGRRLIEAVVLGVDVAASLGLAASSGLRFFRPATAGAFGGCAALGKLMGFDARTLQHAFAIVYGQLCGNMQAHTEGSLLLAMQMGFNARNAVVACDLAREGFEGPANVLEGPFGYFRLIEPGGDPGRVTGSLGKVWRITEVAHKPFPSGRATHGIIEACLELKRRHGFEASEIAGVRAFVPPLVHHLVGRPPRGEMQINYARLCASYVAACAFLRGAVVFGDFNDAAHADPATQGLARRIAIEVRDARDPNALAPVEVEVTLATGARHAARIDVVYGNPAKPMTREAHIAKFASNAAAAARPLRPDQVQALVALVEELETIDDVTRIVDNLIG